MDSASRCFAILHIKEDQNEDLFNLVKFLSNLRKKPPTFVNFVALKNYLLFHRHFLQCFFSFSTTVFRNCEKEFFCETTINLKKLPGEKFLKQSHDLSFATEFAQVA